MDNKLNKNETSDLKDITLDIEEAQYFVQKYIVKSIKKNKPIVFASSNQLRKFLELVNQINNKLLNKDKDIINDIKYMKAQLAYLVGRNKDDKDNYDDLEINKKLYPYLSEQMRNALSYYKKDIKNNIDIKLCKKGIEALYIRILPKINVIIEKERLEDFKELARYIEAIVAYYKFYGGN